MQELVWDNTLSVQIDEIDEDHRRLVDLFNLLQRAVTGNEPQPYVQAVMDELVSCTAWHFKHEERLMLKHGYPGMADHHMEHQELIEGVVALQQQTAIPTDAEIKYMERWLTGHILGADMDLGAYLGEVM